ncbi:OPT oligopeptide transporter protein-domain-containing protein [Thamnocephalis sphaerospora]|uniref:OPT oligopeptide transporter protein-domain-containing protein n=1 Tax=Thamnocephalis sphaerospora TaxID=78915 RepID=A0A4P9XW83_9FUNG|nr:OPT oligopeptide transporter protein-domain-containing protein [Thamnocephalis sphaerospora]|eukprot:RKP09680.1 OPT oligopeptide transporter protein-domain-containing protein [Thamnocephalis sphaerospora]
MQESPAVCEDKQRDESPDDQHDPDSTCLTFRFWILATLYVILAAGCSQIFHFRANFVAISSFFVQFTTYPLGRWMAAWLPRRELCLLGLFRVSLNPGPFGRKEHMLINVAVNAGGIVASASDLIAVQQLYFGIRTSAFGALLLLLSTQLIGYGMAGYLRCFLVRPSAMIWPSALVQVSLYNTLHADNDASRNNSPTEKASVKQPPRYRFFVIAFVLVFLYHILPLTVMPVLTSLSVVCIALPRSPVAQLLGSGMRGLGLGTLSFDWAAVGSFAPMYTPWWAQVNFFLGSAAVLWVLAPLMWYFNIWDARLFPSVTVAQYDEGGGVFQLGRILNHDLTMDPAKLAAYSQLRMPTVFAVSYGATFLALAATITHVALYYGGQIMRQLRELWSSRRSNQSIDVPRPCEVPWSWFLAVFATAMGAAVSYCELYPARLPWWALMVSISLAALMALPIGVVQAVSNNRISISVLAELVCGYLYPGRPLANAMFKVYGTASLSQCMTLVGDMKLGRYMKVPPRQLFVAQLWGTVIGALVNYAALLWVLANKSDVLRGAARDPTQQWDARVTKVFYSSSVLWGAVGPSSVFGRDSPYRPLIWLFLVGLLLPIPFYLLHRRFPRSKWRLVNVPLLAAGAYAVPQSPANFLLSSFIVGFVSQVAVRRYFSIWWRRYNYVLSAALDTGSQLAGIVVFLAMSGVAFPIWWGNARPVTEHCNMSLLTGKA